MRTFAKYLSLRENSAYDVGNAAIGDNTLSSSEEKSMSNLFNIVKLSWSRYKGETKQFIDRMGSKDPEIKKLADELDNSVSTLGSAARKTDDPVSQPDADMGASPDNF